MTSRPHAAEGAVRPSGRVAAPSWMLEGRIAFFVRAFDGGGAQRDAVLLANAISDAGTPTAIVTLHDRGPLGSLVSPDVPVVDLGRGEKLRMARALRPLRHALREGRPSVFVASEAAGNALAVLASRTVARARRPRIVLREVASALHARRNDPYVQNRIAYRAAPLLYPMADRVLTLTRAGRQDLIDGFRLRPDRVVALNANAVVTEEMWARIAASPRAPEPGHILAIGRLSPEKGFDTAIEAMGLLVARRSRTPTRLTILGEGPERARLEALVAARGLRDHVDLPGFAADPVPMLRRAALFVSSSTHEGLGNAIIEALACGVPVVSTDAPHGPREVLEDGCFGTLVPVGDAKALAGAVGRALDDPPAPAPGVARARDFTATRAAEAFLAALPEPA